MKTTIQIKSIFGKRIFEFEKENNTVMDTVIEAVRQKTNLSYSNLSGSDLRGSDLSYSNLSASDLRGSDLSYSNLSGTDLRGSDLSGSNLRGSDLRGSNLSGVKIKQAVVFTGLYKYMVIPFIGEDNEKYIKMGCYTRKLSEWESDFWNNNEEFPNDNSEKSNMRLFAFETAVRWFKLIENQE